MPRNSDGATVYYGSQNGDYGGDTNLDSNVIYYCGRQMNQCRCGRCNGACGPTKGCPCNACIGLLGFKINKDNVLCKRGSVLGSGGDTGMKANDLYYCARKFNECRCGECLHGTCGPSSGCPCNSCLELVGLGKPANSSSTLIWVPATDPQFRLKSAVSVGMEDEYRLFIGRSTMDGETVPGKYFEDGRAHFVHSVKGEVTRTQFEVLMDPLGQTKWVECVNGKIPSNAVPGGHSACGDSLFIGRAKQNGHSVCGKIMVTKGLLVFGYFKRIFKTEEFEILICPESENGHSNGYENGHDEEM